MRTDRNLAVARSIGAYLRRKDDPLILIEPRNPLIFIFDLTAACLLLICLNNAETWGQKLYFVAGANLFFFSAAFHYREKSWTRNLDQAAIMLFIGMVPMGIKTDITFWVWAQCLLTVVAAVIKSRAVLSFRQNNFFFLSFGLGVGLVHYLIEEYPITGLFEIGMVVFLAAQGVFCSQLPQRFRRYFTKDEAMHLLLYLAIILQVKGMS